MKRRGHDANDTASDAPGRGQNATPGCMSPKARPVLEFLAWQGGTLAARRFLPPPGVPAADTGVLFLHGWSGSQDAHDAGLARQLAQLGYECCSFDLAGHGHSPGAAAGFTLAEFEVQALAAGDWSREGSHCRRWVLCGASLGAYLALLMAAARPVAGLVLRVPANYPDEIRDAMPLAHYVASALPKPWRANALPADATCSLRALARFSGPVLLIAAEHDEVIPPQATHNYAAAARLHAAPLEEMTIPGATHTLYALAAPRRAVRAGVTDWLLRHFPVAASA
jgi:pimeloyl-ACP methyl ester carboxylesterase